MEHNATAALPTGEAIEDERPSSGPLDRDRLIYVGELIGELKTLLTGAESSTLRGLLALAHCEAKAIVARHDRAKDDPAH